MLGMDGRGVGFEMRYSEWVAILNLDDIESGMYFLLISGEQGFWKKKIMVSR